MQSRDIMKVVNQLSAENNTAKFTPFKIGEVTRRWPYGYYNFQSPSSGPVMIFLDHESQNLSEFNIKIQNKQKHLYIFQYEDTVAFGQCIQFAKSLKTETSNITSYEATEWFRHFIDSKEKRDKYERHYLNTRIIYDTMFEMIQASPENTKITSINGGYIITAPIDKRHETMQIRKVPFPTQSNSMSYLMSIDLPIINLHDRFVYRKSESDMWVYNLADLYLQQIGEGKSCQEVPQKIDFTRWDNGYKDLMEHMVIVRNSNERK